MHEIEQHTAATTLTIANRHTWGTLTLTNPAGELLRITAEGDVIAKSLEDASEAGRVFVEAVRNRVATVAEVEKLRARVAALEAELADAETFIATPAPMGGE